MSGERSRPLYGMEKHEAFCVHDLFDRETDEIKIFSEKKMACEGRGEER